MYIFWARTIFSKNKHIFVYFLEILRTYPFGVYFNVFWFLHRQLHIILSFFSAYTSGRYSYYSYYLKYFYIIPCIQIE